jgi:hypothetical protein
LGREERLTGDAVMMIQALTGVAAGGNPKPRREAATTQARVEEAKREMREASWRRVFFLFASPFLYLFRLSFCGFTVVPLAYIYIYI